MARRKAWIITWTFAILPLLGWWLYGLFDLDEGFYGAVVAEMNRRGEWITPYYNGHPWFEKPILLYWAAKPFIWAFGDWFGPRLPSVLATVGVYLLVAWFARRRWDDFTARWCVLVTASSLLVVGVGRMMMTDALLNFCLVGAFIFFWESLAGERKWRLLSAFFLGLSVLAKGPVGILLFVPVVALLYWRAKEVRLAFRGGWLLGTLILAATIAIWYVPAYLVNGHEFVQKFLVEQNLNRFTGGDPAHTLPFFAGLPMYFVVLLVGMAPWSFYFWKAFRTLTPNPLSHDDPHGRGSFRAYLILWALVPFVFFTISKAKLPHYVLPCCVPLALLVGCYLADRYRAQEDHPLRALRFPMITCGVVAVLANAAFIYYYNLFHAEVHQLAFYVRNHIQPDEDVAAYEMSRRQAGLGTGKLEIQETVHPSLVMYLNRDVLEPDNLVLKAPLSDSQVVVPGIYLVLLDPHPTWIITRKDRMSENDVAIARSAGRMLSEVATGLEQKHYRLYYLTALPGPRTRR